MLPINTTNAARPTPPRLSLALLGPPQIQLDGRLLTFAYDKVQALLVYLAVESGRTHRRIVLAELLWPEQDELAARHSLSQALFSLRRTINDDLAQSLLLTTRDTVRFNSNGSIVIDIVTFQRLLHGDAESRLQRLAQASDLYRGEFLAGLSIGDSSSFEEWLALTREQLRNQASEVLRALTEPESGVFDPTERSEYARRWLTLDPWHEEAHRRLMRSLAQSGQRTAALAQFEQCRRILASELGIEPEPATLELFEELKRGDAPTTAIPVRSPLRKRLPLPATRLIGREHEHTALTALLSTPHVQLVTLVGPGGVGKTRLALHTASQQSASFADGVLFVPLAPVREPTLALTAIAETIGVPPSNTRSLEELVYETLAERQMLLVLDNCEHLLPAIATLVSNLLTNAPQLVVLATSRIALRLSYERRYQLAPLSLPASHPEEQSDQTESAAVALFVERARAARPSIKLDQPIVSAICRRLDGLPLAIELAATRTRLLSPQELLNRLEQPLAVLRGGAHDLPARQQTLHATIAWSYNLLEAHQQAIFRRLAVFADGWTVTSAEAVCADLAPNTLLDGLTALLDASLINETNTMSGEPRCSMLETIREYALEQLANCGELEATQQRHAEAMATLAEAARFQLTGPEGSRWTTRLLAEQRNFNAALRTALDQGQVNVALRIGGGIWRFWWRSGFAREGLRWLYQALNHPSADPTSRLRVDGLRAAGVLAWAMTDYPQAHRWLAEGLTLARHFADQQSEAAIHTMLGIVTRAEGHFALAREHFAQSQELSATFADRTAIRFAIMGLAEIDTRLGNLDDAENRYQQCIVLNSAAADDEGVAAAKRRLANVYYLQQHAYAEAEALCAESLARCRMVDDQQGLSQTLLVLGNLAREQCEYPAANRCYLESLELRKKLGQYEDCAQTLEALAISVGRTGLAEQAVQLLSVATQLRRTAHAPLTDFENQLLEPSQAAWRIRIGEARFAELWQRGQLLTLDQAIALLPQAYEG